jgi:glycosyltransferase involved in cell wall biosynthesis
MFNPKISVITPSFNSGNFIERAIKSVREQHYENVEHIIVDGGSTDSTIDFLKSNCDLIWISEPDKGQSDAMNKGYNMSTGDIIVYLNADDYFTPNAFQSVVPYFEKGHKIVMGNIILRNDFDGTERVVKPKYTFKDMLRHWERDAFCFNPVGYFYVKEVQESIPFNILNHLTMDVEFLLEVSLKYKICKLDEILGVFTLSKECKTGINISDIEFWQPEKWPYINALAKENLDQDEFAEFEKLREIGYQQRRQRIIKSLINSIEFEELINKNQIIPFPTTDYSYQYQSNKTYSRVIPFNEFFVPRDRIINILQVGKVASTSIAKALLSLKYNNDQIYPVYHTHTINPYYFPRGLSSNNSPINHLSSTVSQIYNKHKNNFNWSFITLVRDPISIAISLIFEDISNNADSNYLNNNEYLNIEEIRDQVLKLLFNYILPYWDVNYRNSNILDLYAYQFPKEKGWSIVKNGNIEVLIMTYEKVNVVFTDAIKNFLGISGVSLPMENITKTKDKNIANNYDYIKNNLRFKKGITDQIFSHPFVSHFYNETDILKMQERWTSQDINESTCFAQPFPTNIKSGVSLFTAIKNRNELFEEAIKTWLEHKEIDEIIVVDWTSDRPVKAIIDNIQDERITLIRVEQQEKWVLAQAYNLAAKMTTYDHILKIDSDVKILHGFFDKHQLTYDHFYAGNWELARNKNEIHLNGILFLKRSDFFSVGGYNEFLKTYGWDDSDIQNRLITKGLKKQNFDYDTLSHIEHEDRMANQSRSTRFQNISDEEWSTLNIFINRFLCEKMNWSIDYKQAGFQIINQENNYLIVEMLNDSTNHISENLLDEGLIIAVKKRIRDFNLQNANELFEVLDKDELFQIYQLFLDGNERSDCVFSIVNKMNSLLSQKLLFIEEQKKEMIFLKQQIEIKNTANLEHGNAILNLQNEIEHKNKQIITSALQTNELDLEQIKLRDKLDNYEASLNKNHSLVQHLSMEIDALHSSFTYKIIKATSFLLRGIHNLFSYNKIKNWIIIRKNCRMLIKSKLFDQEYYLNNNSDVAKSRMNPVKHFLLHGGFEGRNPSKDFNSEYYLQNNPDVKKARINPLLHYLLHGKNEGREIQNVM